MRYVRRELGRAVVCLTAAACVSCLTAAGQSCTTQSRMTPQQRAEIGSAAYGLGAAVLAGDAAKVRANTVAQYAGDNATGYLVRTTSERIAGDSLAVTQAYLLDASGRAAGAAGDAEFACALAGTTTETDFAIPGLPTGRFAFAMVEARGANPWLLAFLLQQEGGGWKMAGFYPHPRAVAGHDGVWYWTAARADAKSNKPWLAWVHYSTADELLRPAGFVSSGNLDKLRTEQRSAAPQALTNGLSVQTPMSLVGPNGTQYRVTSLGTQSSDDGKAINLLLHIEGDAGITGEAATARNVGAATALLKAHPELRDGFENIWVVADVPGANPFVVQRPVSAIAAVNP